MLSRCPLNCRDLLAVKLQIIDRDPAEEICTFLEDQFQRLDSFCNSGLCRCQIEQLRAVCILRIDHRKFLPIFDAILLQGIECAGPSYEASLKGDYESLRDDSTRESQLNELWRSLHVRIGG